MKALLRRPGVEAALAALGLGLLALVAFESYVRGGGFISDDWALSAHAHFHGLGETLDQQLDLAPRRPLSGLYFAFTHTALGSHEHWHLAVTAGLRTLGALLLFLVLREIEIDRLSAAAAAALALLFPYSDATAMWAATGQVSFSIVCWLAGVLVALKALRAGPRGRWWHLVAVALYMASILFYELTFVLVLLSGVLYLLRAPRQVALRRWAADVAGVALAVLFFTSRLVPLVGGDDVHETQDLGGTVDHLRTIGDQGLTLVARALFPFGSPARTVVLLAVLALVAVALVCVRRTRDDELRSALIRWLAVGGGAVVVVAAGWLSLGPADSYYVPGQPGIGNRINAVAGVGLAVLVVALARLAGTLAFASSSRHRLRASAIVVAIATIAVGAEYLDRLETDRKTWIDARRQQAVVLTTLRTSMPPPPAGSTLLARGFPLAVAPGVPVFAATWDLDGAAKLLWGDSSLRAWPVGPGQLRCSRAGVGLAGPHAPKPPGRFGRSILIDVDRGTSTPVENWRRCLALARAGRPAS